MSRPISNLKRRASDDTEPAAQTPVIKIPKGSFAVELCCFKCLRDSSRLDSCHNLPSYGCSLIPCAYCRVKPKKKESDEENAEEESELEDPEEESELEDSFDMERTYEPCQLVSICGILIIVASTICYLLTTFLLLDQLLSRRPCYGRPYSTRCHESSLQARRPPSSKPSSPLPGIQLTSACTF